MTAGIYARISLDRQGGEGVSRQLADCRALAAERGWTDLVEYVDNDISAFRRKKRPEYDRLIADLHDRRIDAVVAYHPDRLYRQLADLETFVAAIRHAGATVATVKAGDVDVSTASGQMIAEILASVSKHEAARIGERVSRSKKERAAAGRPSGGGRRPFGLTHDRTALVPAEADALRAAAAEIVAGATIQSQVDRLNDSGIRNTSGRQWTIGTLRRTLTAPHVAGLRTYHGEIIGDAAWPTILDRDTWETLRLAAASRAKGGRPPSDRHLLTGLLECWRCGRTMWASTTRTKAVVYRCHPASTTRGRGCGRTSISGERAESYVEETVEGWLQSDTFVQALDSWLKYGTEDMAQARVELDAIERQQVALAERWAAGSMPDAAYDAASATLVERHRAAEARAGDLPAVAGSSVSAADLVEAWGFFTVPERREAVRLMAACPIVVAGGRTPAGDVVPAKGRMRLRPVWET